MVNPKDVRKILQAIEEEIFSRSEMDLKDMLSSPSAYVRARAIKLASDREIAVENIETYLEDPSPDVRRNVLSSMAKTGTDPQNLLRALDDPSDIVRSVAVKELVEMSYEDVDLARKIAIDPSRRVRKAFVTALVESGVDDLLTEFDVDPSNDIQALLSAYRGEIDLDEEKLSPLPKKLQKMAFASKLVRKDSDSLAGLVKSLPAYRSAMIKESVIEVIAMFPEELSVPVLRSLVESEDRYISLPALKNYRKIKGYDSLLMSVAERLMDSEDEECRHMGAQYLKGILEPSSVDILRKGLEDPSDRVRALCLETLANLLDYSIEGSVEESLRSTSSRLKKSALRAVKKLKMTNSADLVGRLLTDKKQERPIRILAASVAGSLKLAELSAELEGAISDVSNDGRIRIAAARALARISPDRLCELFGIKL